MRNRTISSASLVICVALTAACGSDGYRTNTTTPPGGTGSSGLANPASEFCVEQGGTVEIVTDAYGQVGYCNLPDGTRVEEQEYYRAEHPDDAVAPPTY